jgi:hypothetical protein
MNSPEPPGSGSAALLARTLGARASLPEPWERGHPCPHPGSAGILAREWAGAENSPRRLMPLR